MFKENYGMLDRKRLGILKKMGKVGPFIMASAAEYKMKCAQERCRCQEDVKRYGHATFRISWTDAEGDGTAYIPVALREEVKEWIENYWEIKEYMKEMTGLSRRMIKMYAKTVGRGRRELKKRKKT